MLNITRTIFLYIPLGVVISYILSIYFNLGEMATRAYDLIAIEPSGFYSNLSLISVALMGFLIVALPLMGDAFSKEKLGRVKNEFYEKGGVVQVLNYLMYTIALTGLVFGVSSVIYLFHIGSLLFSFVLVSTLMLVSLVYLAGSLYIMYLVIQSTRPPLNLSLEDTKPPIEA